MNITVIPKPLVVPGRGQATANVNACYGPYQSLQEAILDINITFINNPPIGLTFAINDSNGLREYWWNGSEFALKINRGNGGGGDGGYDDTAVYEAIHAGDLELSDEIDTLRDWITENMPETVDVPDILNRIANTLSAFITIYSNNNTQPTGGSYNFDNGVLDTTNLTQGWSLQIPNSGNIYYSEALITKASYNNINWSIPSLLILNPGQIINGTASSKTYPAQVFTSSNETVSNVPTEITFDTLTKKIVIPNNSIWRDSPTDDEHPELNVWVSYNNYIITDGVNGYTETGWTTPQLFIDIDGILDKAAQDADDISKRNLQNALDAIDTAISNANSKITELNNLKTQLRNDVDDALDDMTDKGEELDSLAQEAQRKIDYAKDLIDSIESGDASVGGLLSEISEIKGQIKNYGWAADTEITNYHWELDGTTVNNVPNIEIDNKLKLTDIHHVDNIYFILDRVANGEYKLYKTNLNGVKEVDNNTYITVTYDNGAFVPNSSLVTSVLVCKGTPSTETVNYVENFTSAAEGVIRDTVEQAVLKSSGSAAFNSAVRTLSAKEINQMVWGQETTPNGVLTISASIIDQTKDSIKLDVAGSNFDGTLSQAIFNISKDYIDLKVTEVSGGIISSTSIEMTPEQIVLSAINSNNVALAIYDLKGGNQILNAVIGSTYKTDVINGKRYVYKENPTKYITVNNGSLVENNEQVEFNGYLQYITLTGNTASEALQNISSNEIVSKVWGNNDLSGSNENYAAAIQRLTKYEIANEISATSSGNFLTALSNLKANLKQEIVTEINTGEGEVHQTSMTMTPEEIVLSAINSNNIVYKLYEIVNDTPNLIQTYPSQDYTWTIESNKNYFQKKSNNKYYYISNHAVAESNSKVEFEGKIEYGIADGASVKGSFLNMLDDSLSLNVANSGHNATITLKATDNGSTIDLASGTVNVTGTMIASAITSDNLNIANTTYIKGNGDVWMGQGTDGSAAFNHDGSGYLAGGLVTWGRTYNFYYNGSLLLGTVWSSKQVTFLGTTYTVSVEKGTGTDVYVELRGANSTSYISETGTVSQYRPGYFSYTSGTPSTGLEYTKSGTFDLNVQGIISATGGNIGDWEIANDNLVSWSGNDSILLQTGSIKAITKTSSTTYNTHWELGRSGNGSLANGNISWDSNGVLTVKTLSTDSNYAGRLLINSTGVAIASTNGGGISVDSSGVSINSNNSTSNSPYIVVNNSGEISLLTKYGGNGLTIDNSSIYILAGTDLNKSLEYVTEDAINFYAGATQSNNTWNSDVKQSISSSGIGLYAAYKKNTNDSSNTALSAFVVTKGTGGVPPSYTSHEDVITSSINNKHSSKGRIALVSAGLNNGIVNTINAYISVAEDGIYAGGNKFLFGSNAGAKLYILDNEEASIVIGNVADSSNPGNNSNDTFIAFNKNNGHITIGTGSGGNDSFIEIASDGITIGADVDMPGRTFTASEIIAGSGNVEVAGITSKQNYGNHETITTPSSDDLIIWAGSSSGRSNAKFKVFGDGSAYFGGNKLSIDSGGNLKINDKFRAYNTGRLDIGGTSSSPKIRLDYDGSGWVANGNISWDSSGNTNIKATGTVIPETVITENNYTEYFTKISSTGDVITGSGNISLPISGATYMLNLYRCSASIIIDNDVIKNHVKNVVFPFWTRRYNEVGDNDPTDMYVSGVGDMANYAKFHSCTDKVYSITILLTTSGLTNNDTTCNFYFGPSINGNVELMHLGEWIGTGGQHYYVLNRLDEELKYGSGSGDAPSNVYVGWYETDLNNYPVVAINLDEMFGFKFSILDQIIPNGRGSNYLTYQYTVTKSPIYTIYYNGMGAYYENYIF